MKALLKCYYGYQNRGDELLFFGVVSYLFDHDDGLTHLDVEVGDVSWMHEWCELNHDLRQPYKSRVRFVSSRTFGMWFADYSLIYLGGGEVLASKTRSFWHGGVNYLALFWRWIWTGRVVWLGGIETPSVWWSKLLYRMMLPHAQQIVCREQGSYEIAKRYTDQVVLYHDWAIDVLDKIGIREGEHGLNMGGTWVEKCPEKSDKDLEKSEKVNIGCRDTISACPNGNGANIQVPIFRYTEGIRGIRDDAETKPRRTIQAIIKNKSSEEYLLIERRIDGLRTFVGGGVEQGETEIEALAKEVREEAGFDHIDIIQQIGGEVHRHFYHELKGYNNYTITTCYLVEVDRAEQGIIDSEELEKHCPIWISYEEILNQLNDVDPDNAYFFKLYQGIDVENLERTDAVNQYSVLLIGEHAQQRMARVVVPTQPYILINFIPRHTTSEIIQQFHEWMQDYPDHQIINFPAERGDVLPEEIVMQYADRIQTRQRWDPGATGTGHAISDTLALFQQADAGFGQRLHFIIACVYYRIPIFRTSYSEKVDKILQFFATEL